MPESSPIVTQPIPPEWSDIFAGREIVFALLGKAIYSYPDKEWLDSLVEENVFDDFPLIIDHKDITEGIEQLQKWSEDWRKGIPTANFEALKSDYNRMFIGLGTILAPPWESVHLSREKLLFQEQTIQVRKWYFDFGLEIDKLNKEPDDHVGLELSFLSFLSNLCLKALEENDTERLEQLLQAIRRFITEHMLKWVPAWCEMVEEYAVTDFYSGQAKLIRGTLFALADSLGAKIPKRKKN
ncbi:MAG: molecular chaperone TorD family protein [Chloroflexota bacterium]